MSDDKRLKSKKLFLLDMDGTIYLGDRLFGPTPAFLDYISATGRRAVYLTNNSSLGNSAYVKRLAAFGIASTEDDFYTSAEATASYLLEKYSNDKKIYVFGTGSFYDDLARAGLCLTHEPDDDTAAIVCGYDPELNFKKITDACRLLTRGVDFVATNPDWVCPTSWGYLPDCGSVCEMLFRATGRKPVVIGKPQPTMIEGALAKYGYTPDEAIVVGDRVYTDVASGVNSGIDSALVLSGEGTVEDVRVMQIEPTFIFKDVGDLLNTLKEEDEK